MCNFFNVKFIVMKKVKLKFFALCLPFLFLFVSNVEMNAQCFDHETQSKAYFAYVPGLNGVLFICPSSVGSEWCCYDPCIIS